jgi:dihydrofolate synthase/folylpolyglutamate synthase
VTTPASRPPALSSAPDRLDRPFDDPLFERLFPPLPAGVDWGLGRVEAALEALGNPQLRAPALHIGGTNGKGSVASTCASVLECAGRRTGLYTSPHLCSVRERFQVGGRPIADPRLIAYADEIRDVVAASRLTFFEAATVLAFYVFAREEVEVQVIEVGLGGRLDATNVLRPVACAITNVALDHAEFLGDTLESIAGEKAGIIKAGVPVVSAEASPALRAVFLEVAQSLGAPIAFLDPSTDLAEIAVDREHTTFSLRTEAWGPLRLETPLIGRHQAINAAVAVRLLAHLPRELRPDSEAVLAGVAGVRWPGRDQIEVVDGVTWLLDVAHNVAGIESLVSVLDRLELPAPRVALIGVLGDKEWRRMLPPLLRRVDRAILTQPDSAPESRRWDPEAALEAVSTTTADQGLAIEVEVDFKAAVRRAASAAAGGVVVVTGSCHTVGDALRALGRVPFEVASI